MKHAAVVIDKWKLKIFKRVLDEAGYKYVKHPSVTKDTLTLRVEYASIDDLSPVIKKANNEAAKSKAH